MFLKLRGLSNEQRAAIPREITSTIGKAGGTPELEASRETMKALIARSCYKISSRPMQANSSGRRRGEWRIC